MTYFDYHNALADKYARLTFSKDYASLDMFQQDAIDDHIASQWMDIAFIDRKDLQV